MIKRKKEILVYFGYLGLGGAERVLLSFFNNLNQSKYNIDLAIINASGPLMHLIPNNINIIPLWDKYSILYKIQYRLAKYFNYTKPIKRHVNNILKKKYDIEISFQEGMPLKIHSIMKHPVKNITWVHIDMVRDRYSAKIFHNINDEYESYKLMDNIICVSNDCKKSFDQTFPECKNRSQIIYNSIDISQINEKANEYNIRYDSETTNIICVGRLTEIKGFDRILGLARIIKEKELPAKIRIIGDGELFNTLNEKICQDKLEEFVELLGYKINPFPYIKASDIYISSSKSEGFCLAMCEAMALSIPIISTKTVGPIEILHNNQYGILCDHNSESIFKAFYALHINPQLRKFYSDCAYNRVKCFDKKYVAPQIENLLDKN